MASCTNWIFWIIHSDNPIVREKALKNNIIAEKIWYFQNSNEHIKLLKDVENLDFLWDCKMNCVKVEKIPTLNNMNKKEEDWVPEEA